MAFVIEMLIQAVTKVFRLAGEDFETNNLDLHSEKSFCSQPTVRETIISALGN